MERFRSRAATLALPQTISSMLRQQARACGDRPAFVWIDAGLTQSYAELDAAADRVASALFARGARKGTHIAVMSPSAPLWPIVWFAIARLGAVLVPINGSYTSAELTYALTTSDAQFLIIDDSLQDILDGVSPWPASLDESRVFVVGRARSGLESWGRLVEHPGGPFEPPWTIASTDLFNLQYTSGTTGRPKACMLTHEYWLQSSALEAELVGRPLGIRRTLLWQPLFYMAAPWRSFMTLMLGGTVFVPNRMSAKSFYGWLRDFQIHYCTFPEWVLEHCPRQPTEGGLALRYVHAYGWNSTAHVAFERGFGVPARDSFGMSEVGIATETPLEASHMVGSGTCGLAYPFRSLQICDQEGDPLPPGQSGELCIAGPGILTGYYKRPDANVESFRREWFRTGDLARQDDNGYYYIVGRLKEVIRRSGENISAREVENALKEIAGVSEVAVVAVPDPQRGQEVKAYLKLTGEASPDQIDPQRVLQHCANTLARFKWPRYIAYVDEFPRTPTRKVAKAELIRSVDDLRLGSYDAIDGIWR